MQEQPGTFSVFFARNLYRRREELPAGRADGKGKCIHDDTCTRIRRQPMKRTPHINASMICASVFPSLAPVARQSQQLPAWRKYLSSRSSPPATVPGRRALISFRQQARRILTPCRDNLASPGGENVTCFHSFGCSSTSVRRVRLHFLNDSTLPPVSMLHTRKGAPVSPQSHC